MIKIAKLSVSPQYFKWLFPENTHFNIQRYIRTKEWIYDSDNYGHDISFWVVVIDGDPTFYKSEHMWEWDYCDDEPVLENEFYITNVSKPDLDAEAKNNLRFVV